VGQRVFEKTQRLRKVVTIYYFGFVKKEKGKVAQQLDGKRAKWLKAVLPSCRLATLPFTL
jgi:hypothetical protein